MALVPMAALLHEVGGTGSCGRVFILSLRGGSLQKRVRQVALSLALAAACADSPEPPATLWRLAAASIADAPSGRRTWESVAVDSIGAAERELATVLNLQLVARPAHDPVPCSPTAQEDGFPDVSMFVTLRRPSPDSAVAMVVFACDYNGGASVRTSHQTFTISLVHRPLGWRVTERHTASAQ